MSAIIVDGDVVARHAEGLPREVEPAAAGEQLVGEGVAAHEGSCQADGLHAGRAVSRRDHPHAEGAGIEITADNKASLLEIETDRDAPDR